MGIIKYINNIPLFSTSREAFIYGIEINFLDPSKGDSEVDTHIHKCNVGKSIYRSGYMPGRSHNHLMNFLTNYATYDDDGGPDEPGCKDNAWADCGCGIKYCKHHYDSNPCFELCGGDDGYGDYDDDDINGTIDDDCGKIYGYKECTCANGQIYQICARYKCKHYNTKICKRLYEIEPDDPRKANGGITPSTSSGSFNY